jgi:hypothetical protein
MKLFVAAVATVTAALAAPALASAATLAVDPARPCYREQERVFLPGTGFTPNAAVDFSRDGTSIGSIPADASGSLTGELVLPGLVSGQDSLTYRATDTTNPANFAEVTMLVTATDVNVRPKNGRPNRLVTITARGFFGGGSLWAHVTRAGRGATASAARNVRIGRIKGACKKARAKRRLFAAGAAPGTYRVQFDTFRRYKANRAIEIEFIVTIFRTVRPSASAATTTWTRVR